VLQARGEFEYAEQLFRTVLIDRERELGPHHPDTLSTRHNLALTLLAKGSYDDAEQMLRKVLVEREQELGEHHPDTLTTRHNLA